ncbi:YciI family protein [Nocardioides sp. S-58]|uniref:YciI family protein n=1 Tax=Nocardioides renjunii TaxID=3095075 RepID=A0ABU5KA58_9ACTN|nr:YciI family protein [Nocardioides sp. S-58]MDZ5661859.1 YciI family protein [Nocardioides sp. S-58]
MSRYLILLPAPEAEWAELPPEVHEKGQRSHEQFHRDLSAGGHVLVVGGPLEASDRATSIRPGTDGEALVTDGPFSETAEQVVGFYLVESDDEADLRAACERFAGRGEHIELRRLAE